MKNHVGPIIFLVLIAGGLIFFRFNQIPKNLSTDEVEFAKLAVSLNRRPYTPYSQRATGHATLYFYVILASFKLFGINNFALRFPSALFGVINAVIFYLLLAKIFSQRQPLVRQFNLITPKRLALLMALALVSLRWYFNFARFSFEATFLLMLELLALLLVLDESSNRSLTAAGIFTGLAFNSYTPGRLFFLVPLLVLKLTKRWNRRSLLAFVVPLVVVILPLSYYLLFHPDTRINQQSYFTNAAVPWTQKLSDLGENIKKTALMFDFQGDANGRHNYPLKPALNPITGLLCTVGLIIVLAKRRDRINQIFLFFFLVSLIPTLFTYPQENPHMLRTFTVIPSLVYLSSLTILFILNRLKNAYRNVALTIILILLMMSVVYDLRTYYYYQTRVFPRSFEIKTDLGKIMKGVSL
ncbi:glycosyltransferase family 39 protein [Patescibacteria group bacterium]|nr:glycosyltransferase family 39 protein [Patescibacteria group bacterium]MCL5091456.1 glycosyltransferase family 39 protein [Patescibacteria group bacterium]